MLPTDEFALQKNINYQIFLKKIEMMLTAQRDTGVPI